MVYWLVLVGLLISSLKLNTEQTSVSSRDVGNMRKCGMRNTESNVEWTLRELDAG